MRHDAVGPIDSGFFDSIEKGKNKDQKSDNVQQFKDLLNNKITDVNNLQVEADKLVRDFVTGNTDNVHEVLVAINEADLSFRLMMEVRNKLVEAYKEVMRMQV